MQHLFEQVLAGSRPLKRIGCAFMPGVVTFSTLPSLSDLHASSLEHLTLLDRWAQPQTEDLTTPLSDGPAPPLLWPLDLDRMRSLRSLALDFRHFTSPLCQSLSLGDRAPLLRLSLLLENAGLESPPTEVDWRTLVQKSPVLRVSLMAVNLRAEDLPSVLKRSLPLERLHFHSHTACTARAVKLISERYCRTLTHLSLIGREPNVCFPDIRERLRLPPLVLLAWRCRQLSVLALHGYAVWAHDLREISRHGGVHLVDLDIPKESIRFRPDWLPFGEEDPLQYLIKEVSQLLGRAWSPALNSALLLQDPALRFCQEAQSFSAAA
ncbi:hypothetical protein GJAV_G00109580 [Gymnothorax javanicus]|nr:hypothetical protein GJAV_G00109580 [Gymnothorax javanicus]